MNLINERVEAGERGDDIRLEDFAEMEGLGRGQFVKDYLRPYGDGIELTAPEVQLLSFFCFVVSLTPSQLFTL